MAGPEKSVRTQLSASAAMRARNVSPPSDADLAAALELIEASSRSRPNRPNRPNRSVRADRPERRSRRPRPEGTPPPRRVPTPAELAQPQPGSPGRGGSSPEASNPVS